MSNSKSIYKHIPNAVTISRFVLIPFILGCIINNNYIGAFVSLTISGITDILDGFIALKYNFITNFGKVVDPLADKATQVSILAVLALKGIIPMWILITVFLKEFIMVAVASFLYGKDLVVASSWYGKLTTVLFYLAIVSSFAIDYWNSFANKPENSVAALPKFDIYIYYLAIVFAIFSLIMYSISYHKKGYLTKENLKIK